jgi:hypothetical protein
MSKYSTYGWSTGKSSACGAREPRSYCIAFIQYLLVYTLFMHRLQWEVHIPLDAFSTSTSRLLSFFLSSPTRPFPLININTISVVLVCFVQWPTGPWPPSPQISKPRWGYSH